jgi:3-isopropylmalate/(R)-2-methylmalate dehydratase small subunit
MQPLTVLNAVAAPLPMINIDTDMIIPKQFLKTVRRTGLGKNLFDEMRFTPQGEEIPTFVLNQAPYRQAQILIALDNFGCGSSREHAPWALSDFGIRCVIAPSFADIFYGNCFQNGMLPVVLPLPQVQQLIEHVQNAADKRITVDLNTCTVQAAGLPVMSFTLDAFRRDCLLQGLDFIGLTLQHEAAIAAFEQKMAAR